MTHPQHTGLRSQLKRLVKDQRGAVMMIVGLAVVPAVRRTWSRDRCQPRLHMLKSKLSYAIDVAGLAGGSSFETDHREDDIMMFFDANFPSGYLGA